MIVNDDMGGKPRPYNQGENSCVEFSDTLQIKKKRSDPF